MAWAVKEAGQSRNAIELFERAHDAQVSKYGTDDPRTLRTLANLALSYRDAGQSLKATKLLEEVCNTRVKKFEADDPATLIALANLAESYREAGKLPQAIELFERVRDRMVKSLGADHPGTLTLLHNLAGAYLSAGKSPQAIALYERVRDAEVKKLGADHPDTLRTFLTLSAAYFSAGELSRAFALMERARRGMIKQLGADHPLTLRTSFVLAGYYMDAGRLPQALPLLEDAAAGMERRHFQDQYAWVIVCHTAIAYEEAQQFDKAESWRRKWLAVIKKQGGADWPMRAKVLATKDPVAILQQHVGVDSPYYANDLAWLSADLLKQKKYRDAEPVLRECLELSEKLLAKKQKDAWEIACIKSRLGVACVGVKKLAEAEPLLVDGYRGLKKYENSLPEATRQFAMTEAIQGLIDLATVEKKPDDIKKWRAELAAELQDHPHDAEASESAANSPNALLRARKTG